MLHSCHRTCLSHVHTTFRPPKKKIKKIVMDEEWFQNVVMDGQFVKNSVVGAKIDPKVVMDLSMVKIGGWNTLEPSNRILSEGSVNENKPRLSIKILSRDPFFTIQYLERQLMCDDPNKKESR